MIVVCALAVAALYLTGLTRMGMYSTDEPRYADIGRTMAHSGDWVTPRLWGQAWFEKPPLLYWMTATGFRLGLGSDLAPRLPMAILSVGFLFFFWLRLRRVFDKSAAIFSTAILATTAGWLAYSHVAVTDLPLTVFYSAAVFLSLPDKDGAEHRVSAAAAMGLAVLAKSVPPLVLFLPVLAVDRRNLRQWFASWPILAFAAVALPWHVIATVRNGWHFPYVLFIEQQFGRFFSNALQHAQPWWFYGPAFLLLLFPWFPLLVVAGRDAGKDRRTRALAAVVVTGLVFFSASVNKLPGYVLPLVPSTCALMGIALARSTRRERWLVAPIALLGLLPLAASIVPKAVTGTLRLAQISWLTGLAGLAAGCVIGIAITFWLPSRAFLVSAVLAAGGFLWLEVDLFPALDQAGSARSVWMISHSECAPKLPRAMLYGWYYYAGKRVADCAIVDRNPTHSAEADPRNDPPR